MPIRMRAIFVYQWAFIAIEQEALAREGRQQIVRAREAGDVPTNAEFHPAMIAVAACTHSLDALYAELADFVAPETLAKWEEARRGGRWREIAAILDLSVEADVEAWRPRLKTLYEELRNPVVHPRVRWREVVEHPALAIEVGADEATYTVEAVEESVDLLLEILHAAVHAPTETARPWTEQFDVPGLIDKLAERRAELHPDVAA